MKRPVWILIAFFALVLVGLVAFIVYGYRTHTTLGSKHESLQAELETTKATLEATLTEKKNLEQTLEEIRQAFALSEENGAELLSQLSEEKSRNESFAKRIDGISGTVGKLDKLSKLDPELLMKYSKVYFLNEHYTPEKLSEIQEEFRFKAEEPEYISAKVAPFLQDLLDEARDDGIELLVVSGYRSYDEQRGLKNAYTTVYGSGANAFSADQGYSEHQLGTTVDFTTTAVGGVLAGFEKTEAYAWLEKHAHRYGFVLSYPKDNAYYVFEPWHWRFVGEDLARDLHADGKYFYDLDQREIDKYLISIFD